MSEKQTRRWTKIAKRLDQEEIAADVALSMLCVTDEAEQAAVGQRLAAFLTERGESHRVAHQRLGKLGYNLSGVQSGVRRLTVDMLKALIVTLDIDPYYILFGCEKDELDDVRKRFRERAAAEKAGESQEN